jgi:hypothetical protein
VSRAGAIQLHSWFVFDRNHRGPATINPDRSGSPTHACLGLIKALITELITLTTGTVIAGRAAPPAVMSCPGWRGTGARI